MTQRTHMYSYTTVFVMEIFDLMAEVPSIEWNLSSSSLCYGHSFESIELKL